MKKLLKKISHNKQQKKIPIGINILSIIYMISVVFSLVLATILFVNPNILQSLPGFEADVSQITIYSIAIFLIFFSGLSFYIARGLRKGDKNTRVVLIVILIINIIGGVTSVVGSQNSLSWINISLNLIAVLYIFASKKARNHFK